MEKIKVAVLFGGQSTERAVSLQSACAVLHAMKGTRFEAVPVGITREGRWFWYRGPLDAVGEGAWEKEECAPVTLTPDASVHGLLVQGAGSLYLDTAFPVLHGKNGEDGTVQGLLEMAGLPYVGCGVLGSALCMDKVCANLVMDAAGIARCEWDYMEAWQLADFDAIERRVAEKLHYPIFVKPANAGSSVGISKAADKAALRAAVELALRHDSRVVFERFVDGHEIECAVSGNEEVRATLPGEILASAEFYTYDDKYVSGTSRVVIPAQLPEETLNAVRATAEKAYRALCCRGLSRVDFFVERGTGRVLLNEVNTMPGFTDISMYPKLKIAAGQSYGQLLEELVGLALQRAGRPAHV